MYYEINHRIILYRLQSLHPALPYLKGTRDYNIFAQREQFYVRQQH